MAYFNIPNVSIKGMCLCIPEQFEELVNYPLFSEIEKSRLFSFFGLKKHHIAPDNICASDMCYVAAKKLIEEAGWDKDSIDCLVVSTTAPDFMFPATACVLHNRLQLKKSCAAFDVPFGCSGWVYGMSVLASMMSAGTIKRGILLAGDTPTHAANKKDKSSYPYFSDSGTAVLLEYEDGAIGIRSELGTIEESYQNIIAPGFGFRNPITNESLIEIEQEPDITRRLIDTHSVGMDVFSLSSKQDPETITKLLEQSDIDINTIDLFAFHQTNKFLMDRIVKKMKMDPNKVPFSLEEFGNTGGSGIPLTLVYCRRDELVNKHLNIVGCSLGVGISFGAIFFETDKIIVPSIITI